MKIIWLTTVIIDNNPVKSSGGWIHSMFKHLSQREDIEILNLVVNNSKSIENISNEYCSQYCIPSRLIKKNGISKQLLDIVDQYSPTLLHFWGTESKWSDTFLYFQNHGYKCLLEIQGLMFLCTNFFYNGIEGHEKKCMHGILDFVFPKLSLRYTEYAFNKKGIQEKELFEHALYINTQSDYVRSIISLFSSSGKIFKTGIILREEFTGAAKWTNPVASNQICMVTSRASHKGLHTALKAFAILKRKNPNLVLKIAGVNVFPLLNFGYVSYIKRLSKQLGIEDAIIWAGYLKADEIKTMFDESICYFNCSFVETYCLSLAEALSYGIPCVVSHSGALPELAIDNITALTFPMSDYCSAANQLNRIINNKNIREILSDNAVNKMQDINNIEKIIDMQISTYKQIDLD